MRTCKMSIREQTIKQVKKRVYKTYEARLGVSKSGAIRKAVSDYPDEYLSRDYWVNAGSEVVDSDSFYVWQEDAESRLGDFLDTLSKNAMLPTMISGGLRAAVNSLEGAVSYLQKMNTSDSKKILAKVESDIAAYQQEIDNYTEYDDFLTEQESILAAALNDISELDDFEAYEAW